MLCKKSDDPFYFDTAAVHAFNQLKDLISSAPVLRRIDYDQARGVKQTPRDSDMGLIILAVDSSLYGAGWV